MACTVRSARLEHPVGLHVRLFVYFCSFAATSSVLFCLCGSLFVKNAMAIFVNDLYVHLFGIRFSFIDFGVHNARCTNHALFASLVEQ